jgi:hypothetical protein
MADRKRLLENGEWATPFYSTGRVDVVSGEVYNDMKESARSMKLGLTEPIVEEGEKDGHRGRIITVRCGVLDDS